MGVLALHITERVRSTLTRSNAGYLSDFRRGEKTLKNIDSAVRHDNGRLIHTVDEARELLGKMSRGSFYKQVNEGRLRTLMIGRRRYVSADALRKFVAEQEAASAE